MNPFLLEKSILFWYDVAGLPFLRTKQARLLLGTKWVGGKLETVSFQKRKVQPHSTSWDQKKASLRICEMSVFYGKKWKSFALFRTPNTTIYLAKYGGLSISNNITFKWLPLVKGLFINVHQGFIILVGCLAFNEFELDLVMWIYSIEQKYSSLVIFYESGISPCFSLFSFRNCPKLTKSLIFLVVVVSLWR